MLDQSFSYENFRIILDIENRRGRYLEDGNFFEGDDIFEKTREISKEIVNINGLTRSERLRISTIPEPTPEDFEPLNILKKSKEYLLSRREEVLEETLTEISALANQNDYRISLIKGKIKHGSQLYIHENLAVHHFVLKQLQRNVYKTFKVKQANRRHIVSQIKLLLDDGFPKVIVRTDISSFYESIHHEQLLSKIEQNSLLSYPSKKIIKDVLNQYWQTLIADGIKTSTDVRKGIPRGFGISAYLSELYMRDFDRKMSRTPNVTYYARYVDDIIIIFTPESRTENKTADSYKNQVKSLIVQSTQLVVNEDKTNVIDLRKENRDRRATINYKLTYLGYQFVMGYKLNPIERTTTRLALITKMSEKKFERYRSKISIAFDEYLRHSAKYAGAESRANRMLLQRINFISNNFRLTSRKDNVFMGIYFSNEFLSTTTDLKKLDEFLKTEIGRITKPTNTYLIGKLDSISFEQRFIEKKMMKFNLVAFRNGKLLSIWKNL
nr:antiviral reverse transcriptase Drt3a [Pedobacter panaciterrae]